MLKIESYKVYLVPFEERHLNDPAYFEWLTDYEVMRFIGREEYLKPIRFERVKEYVEALWKSKYCSFFAIHLKDDTFIGTLKLNFIDDAGCVTQSADIGIMIGHRVSWGKGLATDALTTICKYAFDKLGVRKLTAGTNASNIGMIKAFKKLGFVEEGRLRKKLLVEGTYHDHILLGCFKEELITPIRREIHFK